MCPTQKANRLADTKQGDVWEEEEEKMEGDRRRPRRCTGLYCLEMLLKLKKKGKQSIEG